MTCNQDCNRWQMKEQHMNEGDKAGRTAMAYLLVALVATWWTIACIAWHHIKEWFL